ncbi:MAG: hypothetical protein ACFFD4_18570 [Candidatus Odinarchaeota archaeon]
MVYKLRPMKLTTKIIFLILVIIFSTIAGTIGAALVVTAQVLPETQFEIRERSEVEVIWNELGGFNGYSFMGLAVRLETRVVSGEVYITEIVNNITGISIDLSLYKIDNFAEAIRVLEIQRENGFVFYDAYANLMVYIVNDEVDGNFTKTQYEVFCKEWSFHLDLETNRFVVHRDPNAEQVLIKQTPDGKKVPIGDYFIVTNRPILEWLGTMALVVWTHTDEFIYIISRLLAVVIIGVIAGFITAFVFTATRINRYIAKVWTFFVIKRLRGKVGRLLTNIPGLFDFGGDWYLEEAFVNVIDLSRLRPTVRELLRERGYDVLIFPTALTSTLLAILMTLIPSELRAKVLFLLPALAPVGLLVLILYYSLVWGTDEGGFRKFDISPQGDITTVQSLGSIIRDGLGIIVSFSGILSLASIAVDVTRGISDTQETATGTVKIAGNISFDLFGIILLVFWTVGLFLVLMASLSVGTAIIALSYLQNTHLEVIKKIREKSEEGGFVSNFGSMHQQFSPKGKETIISVEK